LLPLDHGGKQAGSSRELVSPFSEKGRTGIRLRQKLKGKFWAAVLCKEKRFMPSGGGKKKERAKKGKTIRGGEYQPSKHLRERTISTQARKLHGKNGKRLPS